MHRSVAGCLTLPGVFNRVFGAEPSAGGTAGFPCATARSLEGSTSRRRRRTNSRSGRANAVLTACVASPAVMLPTGTPPIVTPEAITDSGTVVVPVVAVVVVGAPPAGTPPAAARRGPANPAQPPPFTG